MWLSLDDVPSWENANILLHLHGGGSVAGHPLQCATPLLRLQEYIRDYDDKPWAVVALRYPLAPDSCHDEIVRTVYGRLKKST